MWVKENVEVTESRAYSVIQTELCVLWSELKVQRTGRIVLFRVNCVDYGAS